MSLTPLPHEFPDSARPVGFIRPDNDRAIRALKALDDGRLQDAEQNIAAIPDSAPLDQGWKQVLEGLLAMARRDYALAESQLSQAAADLPVAALSRGRPPGDADLRLTARALHQLGLLYRRQDRPEEAYRAHYPAYHLRNEHGSFEEVWETGLGLGIDLDLADRYEDAQGWHHLAIDTAAKAAEEPEKKQAAAWTHLSASLTQSENHPEAVEAARTARDWWHKHDLAAVTAPRADMKLGHALLKQGESLHDRQPELAKPVLEEALQWLTTARESLEAFGPDHAADIRWCLEQQDFAQRLHASLELP